MQVSYYTRSMADERASTIQEMVRFACESLSLDESLVETLDQIEKYAATGEVPESLGLLSLAERLIVHSMAAPDDYRRLLMYDRCRWIALHTGAMEPTDIHGMPSHRCDDHDAIPIDFSDLERVHLTGKVYTCGCGNACMIAMLHDRRVSCMELDRNARVLLSAACCREEPIYESRFIRIGKSQKTADKMVEASELLTKARSRGYLPIGPAMVFAKEPCSE